MRRMFATGCATLGLVACPHPALGATGDETIAAACKSGENLDLERLANAILAASGHYPYELGETSRLVPVFNSIRTKTELTSIERKVRSEILKVEAILDGVPPPGSSTKVTLLNQTPLPERPANGGWLYAGFAWNFKCDGEVETPDPFGIAEFEKREDVQPRFAIRGSVEELAKTGKDIKSAGAAMLAFNRTRSILDDGSRKTDTKFSVNGVAGLLLSDPESDQTVHAYAGYSLSRARTRPRPQLNPGATEAEGDTNALELGFTGFGQLIPQFGGKYDSLWITGSASYIHDFAKDSDIGRLRLELDPTFSPDIGLCGVGSYKQLDASGKVFGRCSIQFQIEGAHVFDAGRAQFGAKDEFLAIGPKLGYTIFAPTFAKDGKKDGVIASVGYRHLWKIAGDLPAIDRLDAKIAYRIWTKSGLGFDIGLTYAKGTNDKSYIKEDILDLGVGVVF